MLSGSKEFKTIIRTAKLITICPRGDNNSKYKNELSLHITNTQVIWHNFDAVFVLCLHLQTYLFMFFIELFKS